MAFSFTPYLDWVDVPDPDNPPAGAKKIAAEDLLRYENGLKAAAAESATYATKADATIQDTTERILTFPTQTGGRVACRRWGPMVEYNIYDVTFSDPATTSGLIINGFFPPGFRPMYFFMYGILADGVKVRIENDGQLLLYGHTTSKYYRGSLTFMTNDAFPDPLPGTPA